MRKLEERECEAPMISLRLTVAQRKYLEDRAWRERKNKSRLVRDIIEGVMAEQLDPSEPGG